MKDRFSLAVVASALAIATAGTVSAATLYVALNSTNPTPPYATWATAAHIIQDAVDGAKAGDTVLVTDGVYEAGERDGNRVAVPNAVRLESVNGPSVTMIKGRQDTDEWGTVFAGVRCVYLGADAVLSGFTLTNGYAGGAGGGGVYSKSSGVVTNCVITGNECVDCAGGGGAFGGTLHNCTLTGNSAIGVETGGGGGEGAAYMATLYNCTLTGNTGSRGSGAGWCILYDCVVSGNIGTGAWASALYNCTLSGNSRGGAVHSTLNNCLLTSNSGSSEGTFYNCTITENQGGISGTAFNSIIYFNTGGNYGEGTTLNHCCTSPLPTNGVDNIIGPPLLMDLAAGDFRLGEDSPCVDAGTNLLGFPVSVWNRLGGAVLVGHITEATDILGNTRFIDGNGDNRVAWDIGAYEFNSFKPPRFAVSPQRTAEGWTLNITGAPNKWVQVQRSGNLRDWEDVWSGFMGAEGAHQCNDGDMGQKVMFYRAVVP